MTFGLIIILPFFSKMNRTYLALFLHYIGFIVAAIACGIP